MRNLTENNPSFFGLIGFVWFWGIVENRDDPEMIGRVQVRVLGIHSEDKTELPDNLLPWANVIQPVTSAALGGVGTSPTGIGVGSFVFGFFMDGPDMQLPLIVGTYAGKPGGTNDVHSLARGENTITKEETVGIEPASPYDSEYPYNKVTHTESGHVIEVDDTPGAERIHVYHRTGTYFEIDSAGRFVAKVIGDNYEVSVRDKSMFVQGDLNIYTKGNINIEAYNDVNLNVSGDLNVSVGEDLRMKAGKMFLEAEEINVVGFVKAEDIDMDNLRASIADIQTIEAAGILAGSVQSTFSPGSGSPSVAEDPEASGLSEPNPRDIEVYVPALEDRYSFENDDTDEGVQALVDSGIIDEPDSTVREGRSESTANNVAASTTLCGITLTEGQNLDNVRLTPNFTVGNLSSFAAATRHKVRAQGGLTENQIVCNLKLLAENCLEKIKAKYPDMIVTSGFRSPAAASQHTKGMAADIQFTSLNALGAGNAQRSAMYERCVWIKDNVPFDQLIMEYKTFGTRFPWIHISFNKDNLRHQMLTYNNNRKHSDGIVELLL